RSRRHLRRRIPRRTARRGRPDYVRQGPVLVERRRRHLRADRAQADQRDLAARSQQWTGRCAVKRARTMLAAALATAIAAPAPVMAWETPTHVGIAEQAAMAANLDARL